MGDGPVNTWISGGAFEPMPAGDPFFDAIKNGISEHYDSVTGKALGVPDYCMSSTLVTMMLDGLARKHRLKLRDKKSTDKQESSARIPPCQSASHWSITQAWPLNRWKSPGMAGSSS